MKAGAAVSPASAHIRCSALVSFVVDIRSPRCGAKGISKVTFGRGVFLYLALLRSSAHGGKQISSDLADGLCCCNYGNVRTISPVSFFAVYFV